MIEQLITSQLARWEVARNNYAALSRVEVKEIFVKGMLYKAQFNPARIVSSGAKVDAKTIRERRCFLCASNRPEVQEGIAWGGHYDLLVNPFPIFPRHLTIPDTAHQPQCIQGRIGEMMELARYLKEYTIFYNGPKCGASAPDHAHFQAGNRGFMPIESQWKERKSLPLDRSGEATLSLLDEEPRTTLLLCTPLLADGVQLFDRLYSRLPVPEGEKEPMMNILAMYDEGEGWTLLIFPRAKHRPDCYFAEGAERLLSSPASVDMGGVFIFPVEEDFRRINAELLEGILKEVCLPRDTLLELYSD